jgi:rRNA maturation endonuclease Nob1
VRFACATGDVHAPLGVRIKLHPNKSILSLVYLILSHYTHHFPNAVVRFARATGDLHSLSAPDIKLIALTYTLEAELYGTAHIRREPPPIAVAKKSQARMKDPPGWGRVPNPADWAGIDEVGDDGKRLGSSSGYKGGSRILGVKALDLETASVASSSGAVSTEEAPEGLEKGLTEGSGPALGGFAGGLDEAPGGLAEGLEDGGPAGQTENKSSTGVSAESGVSEQSGVSETVQEAENVKAPPAKSAPAWGGFTMAPPVVTPSPSNSLRAVEVMSGEAPGTSENTNPLLEAPQSTAQRGFPPQRRGGGRGGGSGRGRQSRAAGPTKPVVVDGVHTVLVEEQAIEHAEGGDGWEKNVSRSTRRKHQRRAYRGAESAPPGEAEAAPLGEAEGGLGDPRSGLGGGEDENAGGDATGGQCIGAGGQVMTALESLQIGGQEEVPGQGGKGAGENAVGGTSIGLNEGGPGEFRGDKKAPEGTDAGTTSKPESVSSDVGVEKGNGAEMQQSRKSSALQGPSVANTDLGGQFSDAEEESDEADATEMNAAEDAASDSASEDSATEEYEYVHQSKDEALEMASVAPSEPGTASEAGWDRASSTVLGKDSEVACMTSDFAMQNVILQMGLRLLSVDGLGITQVHR